MSGIRDAAAQTGALVNKFTQRQTRSGSGCADHRAQNILVLCDFATRKIGTVRDHLDAFRKFSQNNICYVDFRTTSSINLEFDIFDAVVLHYSLVISNDHYLSPDFVKRICDYKGYKILFIQDEYRWVDRTAAAVANLDVDVIYSVVNDEVVDKIYHHPAIASVRRKQTLTGYVPEKLAKISVRPFEQRPIDVGYRARRVPAWIGAFSQEKWHIGHRFMQDAINAGVTCDIAFDEGKRLYGRHWIKFLTNCKAVLGTESGASVIDFSGDVQLAVEEYERENPGASFEEVKQKFFNAQDGRIVINVISPRCFEAAALRTLMIMYPGQYSGILEPWRHYVPLQRDHSNMEEVISVLRDAKRAQTIIDNAYNEVALNPRYSFRAMVEEFDRDINQNASAKIDDIQKAGSRTASQRLKVSAVNKVSRQSGRNYRLHDLPRHSRLQDLQRRARNKFLLQTMPLNKLRQWMYFVVSKSIIILVPEKMQPTVRNWIKTVGVRLRFLKLG